MIHHVFACKSNIGDWLSARGIQSLLQPHAIAEYFCDEPFIEETITRLRHVEPADTIVIGGGGLFMDYFSPFWRSFREIGSRVPFCIWGVGFCDLKATPSTADERLIGEICSMSRLTIVRDALTKQRLCNYALPDPVACPSIVVTHRPEIEARGLLHVIHYEIVGQRAYENMHAIAQQFASETSRQYRQTDNTIGSDTEVQLQQQLDRYRSSDLIVSSRLHGCILGLAFGRKVLAVSGDHKIDAFMRSAGLEDWVCSPEDTHGIESRLRRLHEQPAVTEFLHRVRELNSLIGKQVRDIVVHESITVESLK
jgi:polysaccharide pyruvyl transferase WcaK-like protein